MGLDRSSSTCPSGLLMSVVEAPGALAPVKEGEDDRDLQTHSRVWCLESLGSPASPCAVRAVCLHCQSYPTIIAESMLFNFSFARIPVFVLLLGFVAPGLAPAQTVGTFSLVQSAFNDSCSGNSSLQPRLDQTLDGRKSLRLHG